MTLEIWGGVVLLGVVALVLVGDRIPGLDDLVNGANPPAGFYSNATRAGRVAPGQLPSSIGIVEGPGSPFPIGIASEVGRIGGYDWDADRDFGPSEAVGALVVGGGPVEGRFALRGGVFVALAGDAGTG